MKRQSAPSSDASASSARAAAAARKRRYRARVKAGGAMLQVPVSDVNAVIAALLELHWLAEDASENRKAIGAAVGRMMDDMIAARQTE